MATEGAVDRFSALLDYYPAGFSGNRLNLLLLDDAAAIDDGKGYLRQTDGRSLLDERREYLLDEACSWPFPRACLGDRPDPWAISDRLFERFDEARTILPTQGQIAEMIDRRVRESMPDVVALIIVDGLSFYDLPTEIEAQPCLVEGITVTDHGYRQVVGRPEVSRRLFALGYVEQYGFTYFAEGNLLAQDIHGSFGSAQIVRVRSFDEVLTTVAEAKLRRCYLQITLSGLDHLSHAHLDRPPKDHYLQKIIASYHRLIEELSRRHEHILVALTADHGVLWRENIDGHIQIVDDLFREDLRSPRYVRGSVLRPYGRCVRSDGQNYTLLRSPWMTREFRNNEWGVHGGISAWESIVPLLIHHS